MRTGTGAVTPRVTQQGVQALVYRLNRQLQGVFASGRISCSAAPDPARRRSKNGRPFTVLGLDRTEKLLATLLQQSQRVTTIRNFIHTAAQARAHRDGAAAGTAHPIERPAERRGADWLLLSRAGAVRTGSRSAWRSSRCSSPPARRRPSATEGTIGRLRRGLVSLAGLVWWKSDSAVVQSLRSAARSPCLLFGVVAWAGG